MPLFALALVGNTSVAVIVQFDRLHKYRIDHAFGFHHGNRPRANTFTHLFAKLGPDHLDRLIDTWLADRWEYLTLDGKTLYGSRDGDMPGVHLLAAYAPQASAAIAALTVTATTNEHKEALTLLGVLPFDLPQGKWTRS